jgi:glycerophosphoryl diester phosphodiesterase
MKKVFFFITFLAFALSGVSQTRIIAHRGYWKADGSAHNSLTSLTKAHEIGAYGSEFDVSITTDGVCVVNHDPTINGIDIETSRICRYQGLQAQERRAVAYVGAISETW